MSPICFQKKIKFIAKIMQFLFKKFTIHGLFPSFHQQVWDTNLTILILHFARSANNHVAFFLSTKINCDRKVAASQKNHTTYDVIAWYIIYHIKIYVDSDYNFANLGDNFDPLAHSVAVMFGSLISLVLMMRKEEDGESNLGFGSFLFGVNDED